jgi:hypothetical protein
MLSGPLKRITPMAPSPAAVETALIVSKTIFLTFRKTTGLCGLAASKRRKNPDRLAAGVFARRPEAHKSGRFLSFYVYHHMTQRIFAFAVSRHPPVVLQSGVDDLTFVGRHGFQ